MADEPILCFDGDSAGKKAAFRAIETVMPYLKPGISVRFAFLPDGLDPDDLIRQDGPSAMEMCLSQTRSLVDVLWDREWASGDWSTPERRAQLELQFNTLIARIDDRSVREQYQKDIRNRLFEAWGSLRRNDPRSSTYKLAAGQRGAARPYPSANRQKGNGPRGAYPFGPPVRQPASESLRNSRLGTAHASGPPQREAVFILAMLNHPWLIESRCEEIANLEFTYRPFAALKSALLDLIAQEANSDGPPLDASRLHTQLETIGLDGIALQAQRAVTHSGDRFAAPGTEPAVVEAGWEHAMVLHKTHVELNRALEAAERAWQTDQSEENAVRIAELKALQGRRIEMDQA
jgi:DNA primase